MSDIFILTSWIFVCFTERTAMVFVYSKSELLFCFGYNYSLVCFSLYNSV